MTRSATSAWSRARRAADHREVLGPVGLFRLASHPCGVDEPDGAFGGLYERVDRVTWCARHVVNDRALLADKPVEQSRLPDIRPSDDRNCCVIGVGPGAKRFGLVAFISFLYVLFYVGRRLCRRWDRPRALGACSRPRREGRRSPGRVARAHHERIPETEGNEFPSFCLASRAVHLVGYDDDVFGSPAQVAVRGSRLLSLSRPKHPRREAPRPPAIWPFPPAQ